MNAELILRLRKASRSGSRMVAENLCAEAADYLESLAAQASQERQEPQILGMHAPTQGQIDSAKGLDVLLRKIADEVEILLASARALCDEEGTVKGYNISTGALHSIIGRLTGNGFAVEVPLLDAAPVPAPQEGWISVPVELPYGMANAMEQRMTEGATPPSDIEFALWKEVWKAAIAAAPKEVA